MSVSKLMVSVVALTVPVLALNLRATPTPEVTPEQPTLSSEDKVGVDSGNTSTVGELKSHVARRKEIVAAMKDEWRLPGSTYLSNTASLLNEHTQLETRAKELDEEAKTGKQMKAKLNREFAEEIFRKEQFAQRKITLENRAKRESQLKIKLDNAQREMKDEKTKNAIEDKKNAERCGLNMLARGKDAKNWSICWWKRNKKEADTWLNTYNPFAWWSKYNPLWRGQNLTNQKCLRELTVEEIKEELQLCEEQNPSHMTDRERFLAHTYKSKLLISAEKKKVLQRQQEIEDKLAFKTALKV